MRADRDARSGYRLLFRPYTGGNHTQCFGSGVYVAGVARGGGGGWCAGGGWSRGRRSDWGGAVGAGLRWVAEVGAKRPGAAAVPASVPVGAGRSGGAGDGGQERSPVRAWQL